MYKPKEAAQMVTPFYLKTPTYKDYYGAKGKVSYTPSQDIRVCNFKTYGGTETIVDGVMEIIDTATVTTWYDPAITAGCRIMLAQSGAEYDIIGEPEDIEQRHMIMRFKVRRVKGGA